MVNVNVDIAPIKMVINGNFRILKWRYLPYARPKGYGSGDIPLKYSLKNGTVLHFRILEFPLKIQTSKSNMLVVSILGVKVAASMRGLRWFNADSYGGFLKWG